MNGNKLFEFSSASSAAINTNIRINGILKCCKGERNYAGNFRWSFSENSLLPISDCQYHISRRKLVAQYTLTDELVKVYDSIKEANQYTNIDTGAIISCCKNKKSYHTAGGYIWKYHS